MAKEPPRARGSPRALRSTSPCWRRESANARRGAWTASLYWSGVGRGIVPSEDDQRRIVRPHPPVLALLHDEVAQLLLPLDRQESPQALGGLLPVEEPRPERVRHAKEASLPQPRQGPAAVEGPARLLPAQRPQRRGDVDPPEAVQARAGREEVGPLRELRGRRVGEGGHDRPVGGEDGERVPRPEHEGLPRLLPRAHGEEGREAPPREGGLLRPRHPLRLAPVLVDVDAVAQRLAEGAGLAWAELQTHPD